MTQKIILTIVTADIRGTSLEYNAVNNNAVADNVFKRKSLHNNSFKGKLSDAKKPSLTLNRTEDIATMPLSVK